MRGEQMVSCQDYLILKYAYISALHKLDAAGKRIHKLIME
jgi:hypothetical protein